MLGNVAGKNADGGDSLGRCPQRCGMAHLGGPRRFFTFWCIMFLVHQMAVGLFRLMGAIGRTLVIATSMGSIAVLVVVTMSGFVLAYPQVPPQLCCDLLHCHPCNEGLSWAVLLS